MTPHVVADIGNTRIKWGRCSSAGVIDMASLPPDDPGTWQEQIERWSLAAGSQWLLAGVQPARRDRLIDWLRQRGDLVRVVRQARELPLQTTLAEPEKAGIDRLLNAVAANQRRQAKNGALIVDAGSAVTVDWVDETGAFTGGAILPGFRLMAKALHDYTALLPIVEPPQEEPSLPGTATIAAMQTGIYWSIAGAIRAMLGEYEQRTAHRPHVFLTGGDAGILQRSLPDAELWPAMTLAGLRWTAETLS